MEINMKIKISLCTISNINLYKKVSNPRENIFELQ